LPPGTGPPDLGPDNVKSYWAYRLLFAACIAFSVGLVLVTLSSRHRGPARADAARRPLPTVSPPRDAPASRAPPDANGGAAPLSSRVRITTVVPFRREIHLYNFGDAAETLGGWRLVSPSPGGEDSYTIPLGVVLLPGESLIVAVDEGVDLPGQLHWRAVGEQRVLDLAGDTVALVDESGAERSRFAYLRR
jgi:hypothetical protein